MISIKNGHSRDTDNRHSRDTDNRHSRDTDNFWQSLTNEDKQNKNTTQKRKEKRWATHTDPPQKLVFVCFCGWQRTLYGTLDYICMFLWMTRYLIWHPGLYLYVFVDDKVPYMAPQIISRVRVAQSFVFCVVFCRSLFVTFSFDHCVVSHSSIYGFWLSLWYRQTLLTSEM